MIVVLDTGILGLVTHPGGGDDARGCSEWFAVLVDLADVFVPEIADYELRRELVRAEKPQSIQRLDRLETEIRYLPISTAAMRTAANMWATARQQGYQTADDRELDADVILAAQALVAADGAEVVVATTNVGHLARFVDAKQWTDAGWFS